MAIPIVGILIGLSLLTTSCKQQDRRLKVKTIQSKTLENSILEVNPKKKIAIYLPPSYYESTQRYPVIYYLPGYTSPIDEIIGGEYEGFRISNVMDELIANNSIHEMIVVLCDGSNYLGGNFYVNSPLTGNAEDYIFHDIVQYVDRNYRSIKSASARGLTGHSMGGFGSFNIATKHPDIFSVCYSISPGIYNNKGLHKHGLFNNTEKLSYLENFLDNVNQDTTNLEDRIKNIKKKIKPLFSISYDTYISAFTVAYGAAFNYDASLPFPHIQFPGKISTSKNIDSPAFIRWQKEGFGEWRNKVANRQNNINQLTSIAFDCGREDTWITHGTEHIIEHLISEGITVDSFWHEGGHDDHLHLRLQNYMLPYFSKRLSHE